MKNHVKTGLLVATALAVGFGFNNFAMSDVPSNYRVAVVDVNTVVSNSKQVQDLKKEQQEKMQELQSWLTLVRSDVAKQQTKEGKEKLIKKYDEDFAKKQEAIKKSYSSKLQSIDKSISSTIAKEAKAKNYNLVLAKGTVLYGGEDITASIAKVVK